MIPKKEGMSKTMRRFHPENGRFSGTVNSMVRTHRCDVCGTEGQWGKGWSTYGSLLLQEEAGKQLTVCSNACKEAMDVDASWHLKYGETYSQSESKLKGF